MNLREKLVFFFGLAGAFIFSVILVAITSPSPELQEALINHSPETLIDLGVMGIVLIIVSFYKNHHEPGQEELDVS